MNNTFFSLVSVHQDSESISVDSIHSMDDYLKKNYAGKEKEAFDKLSTFQPIGRMGQPDEIAQLALFLCSDASSFITAAAYDIDGGVVNLR